ncbi:uncharacterized protein LOC132279669 [Cornus florida]|uniref:uncharacterized protein LOC132279669 n=1 Tax=Cornus florida TaxID=4283 RepID=UPI00289AB9A2|nr:uncharacterized protein LOC132279669 [Cornus florida]
MLRFLRIGQRGQTHATTKRDLAVYSSVQPGAPLPSGPPSNSLKHWIVGILISAIVPFFGFKWGPLFKLRNEIEDAVETADRVTEAIENIAEQVEKVADEIGDELPEGGKLQKAFANVENMAGKAAKDAHLVEQFIDKIEAMEEKVDSFIEPVIDEASEIAKETKDNKSSA